MSAERAIEAAMREAGLDTTASSMRSLSGGCIHDVREVVLDGGERIVAKISPAESLPLFAEEAHGLRALAATNSVLVPSPLTVFASGDHAVLLLSHLPPGRADAATWRQFGRELASLHARSAPDSFRGRETASARRYGFEIDNHIGATPQVNRWCDDWVEFNSLHRLGFQLKLARDRGLLRDEESRAIQNVIDRLDRFIPRDPFSSLLHGDLWCGNALASVDPMTGQPRIALIDPACSYGDGLADLAMMRLFGGFPAACFNAYFEERQQGNESTSQQQSKPLAASRGSKDDMDRRIAVYQLYHALNHLNIFGRGYVDQALSLARGLASSP
jgi:fructosamine-3-kinase